MEEPRRRRIPPLPDNFLSLQQLQEMRLREQEQKRMEEERRRKLIEEEEERKRLERQREEAEQEKEKVRKSVEALRIDALFPDGGRRRGFRVARFGERMVFREEKVLERDGSTESDQKEADAELAIQMTKKKWKKKKRKAARRRAAAAAEMGIVKAPNMKLDEAKIGVGEEREAVLVAEITDATAEVEAKMVPRARKFQGGKARHAAGLRAKSAAEESETVDGAVKATESPCEKMDSAAEVSGKPAVGISTNDAVSLEMKIVPNRRRKFRGFTARSAGSKSSADKSGTVNGGVKGAESAVAIEAGVTGKPAASLEAEVGLRGRQGRGPRYADRKPVAVVVAEVGGRRKAGWWGRGSSVSGRWVPKGGEGTDGNGI